jgi:hypothetical protein
MREHRNIVTTNCSIQQPSIGQLPKGSLFMYDDGIGHYIRTETGAVHLETGSHYTNMNMASKVVVLSEVKIVGPKDC